MRTNLVVIDDFLSDPDSMRAYALSGPFEQRDGSGFTGSFRAPDGFDPRSFLDGIARSLGADVVHSGRVPFEFRTTTRAQDARRHSLVHYDSVMWVAFVCLSPPSRAPGMTRFYRHRPSGLLGIHDATAVREYVRTSGRSLEEIGDMIQRDSMKLSQWVEVGSVAQLYNRLIVMRARQFHRAAPGFGRSPADAKLTMQITFDLAGSERHPRGPRTVRTAIFGRGARGALARG
jgi:hypothetical protein